MHVTPNLVAPAPALASLVDYESEQLLVFLPLTQTCVTLSSSSVSHGVCRPASSWKKSECCRDVDVSWFSGEQKVSSSELERRTCESPSDIWRCHMLLEVGFHHSSVDDGGNAGRFYRSPEVQSAAKVGSAFSAPWAG